MPSKELDTIVVEFPLPRLGVNLYKSPVELEPEEAQFTQNCIWRSGVKKRGGQTQLNTAEAVASNKILGLHRFYYGVTKERIVACDTKILKDDEDNTWTEIKTGMTADKETYFTEWGPLDKLFGANGTDAGFTWDGSSQADITATSAPASPTAFLPYQDRMLAIQGGDLVWSASYDETATWETVANCGVRPDTVLHGMIHHSITNSDTGYEAQVLLAGTNGMYLFGGRDLRVPSTTGDYSIYSLAINVGCNAPRTMQWTPVGTMWLGIDRQVYLLPFNSSTPIPIGPKIQSNGDIEGLENIPVGQIPLACAVYHDGFYKLAVAGSGQTTNNRHWWLDVTRLAQDGNRQWGPWYGPMTGRDISVFALQSGSTDSGELIAGEGTAKGFIYQMDVATTTSDYDITNDTTKAIDYQYKTFNNPCGLLEYGKEIHRIELEFLDIEGNINIDYHDITGSVKIGDVLNRSGGSLKWDSSFNWDGSENWSAVAPIRQVLPITPAIQPRRLSILVKFNSSTQKFELYSLHAEIKEQSLIFG